MPGPNPPNASRDPLPTFKYHPDPVGTGSVEKSETTCVCCGKGRGYIYTGPTYGEESYDDCICPWCIADGSAYERLGVEFHDADGVGGQNGEWDEVSDDIIADVTQRTPGFAGWQQEQWFTHCNDAAQYIGPAGRDELVKAGRKAIEIVQDAADMDEDDWESLFEDLDKDGSPTAYLFKCRKCGQIGGYADMD